jgi:hypothetical protein
MKPVLALVVLTTILSGSASAAGAIAFADVPKVGFSGSVAANFASLDSARARALVGCRQGTTAAVSTCRIVASLQRQCGALARGARAAGWGVARTREAAERRAMAMCRSRSKGCQVTQFMCDTHD